MSYEERPNRSATAPSHASREALFANHPSRNAILNHARKTGAELPEGDHVDVNGRTLIDKDGIRHFYIARDGDPVENNNTIIRYKGVKATLTPDKDGYGYHGKMKQSDYEALMKGYQDLGIQRANRRGHERAKVNGRDAEVIEVSREQKRALMGKIEAREALDAG
jgi:hypothetical protein